MWELPLRPDSASGYTLSASMSPYRSPTGSLPPFAQFAADHLAGRGQRQAVDEGDFARIFVRGKTRAHEMLDVGGKRIRRRVAGAQHDEGFDDLGAHRIGLADCRGDG